MSLKLIINNKEADLSESQSFERVRRSSLFNFENAEGSFSLSFDLPYKYSARNKLIFKFVGNPISALAVKEMEYELYFRGTEIARGTLIAKLTSENLSCEILLENGQFNDSIANKTLQNLYSGLLILDDSRLNYTPDDEIAWAFFKNKAQFLNLWMNYTEDGDGITQLNDDCNVRILGALQTSANDFGSETEKTNYTNCPQFFVKKIVERICSTANFELGESFFDLPEFQQLAIFSPYDVNGLVINILNTEIISRDVDTFTTVGAAMPAIESKDFLLWLCGFFCAAPVFDGLKVKFELHSDILAADVYTTLPDSFQLQSVGVAVGSGYRIDLVPPSEDEFYASHKDLGALNVAYTEILDMDAYLYFGPGTAFSTAIDYYYNTLNMWLYGPGERFWALKGTVTDLAKPVLVTKGTDWQPIKYGEPVYKHTVKASAVGNFVGDWSVDVPTRNLNYETTEIKDLRFGFVVNNAYGGTAARFQCQNGQVDLQNWQKQFPESEFSFWQRCWEKYIEWIAFRKSIEAEISGEDAWLFIQTWRSDKKYTDANGNRYIFTELSESFTREKIGTVKLKGWTVW